MGAGPTIVRQVRAKILIRPKKHGYEVGLVAAPR
jgi:hypothetical protein